MKLTKILCPIDFSASSEAALKYAAAMARDSAAELIVVYVDEGPLAYDAGMLGFVEPESDLQPESRLQAITQTLPDLACRACSLQGDPAAQIVQLAKDESVDLIVLGTHGRTGLARLLMGSIAEAVLRSAPCPVLALKQPDPDSQETSVSKEVEK